MQMSTGTRYAVRLLFELRSPGAPVPSALLAEQIGTSLKTVEKIHAVLKKNGITDGSSGPKGGIFLLIPLTEISLGQIMLLFDAGVHFAVCHGNKANECPNQYACSIRSAWGKISKQVQDGLNNISLWSILQEYSESGCFLSPHKPNDQSKETECLPNVPCAGKTGPPQSKNT